MRILRAWADDAHIGYEHVDELRNFVDFRSAEKSTDWRDSWIAAASHRQTAVLRLFVHRSKFVKDKWPAMLTDALGTIEHGTARGEFYEQRHNAQEWREDDKGEDRDDEIEETFHKTSQAR